jgi:hypothetical protein
MDIKIVQLFARSSQICVKNIYKFEKIDIKIVQLFASLKKVYSKFL